MKLSTVSDANTLRPNAVYEALFARLVALTHRTLRLDLTELVHRIDATSLKLNELSAKWARFSVKVCGAELHAIHDPGTNQPIHSVFSVAKSATSPRRG